MTGLPSCGLPPSYSRITDLNGLSRFHGVPAPLAIVAEQERVAGVAPIESSARPYPLKVSQNHANSFGGRSRQGLSW
jgi:hypothetical protein